MKAIRRIVALGAGPAGLSAAWVLARAGLDVTVVEASDRIGGLAATQERDGYRYDLGPHNIHTRRTHVLDLLKARFSTDLLSHNPTFRILKRGTLVDYPIRGLKVLSSLPPWKVPLAAGSFLSARLGMFLHDSAAERSFAEWIQARFGSVLYREYFHDYPAKVWGLPPEQIDRHVAERRVAVLTLTELVRSVVLGRKPRLDHPEVTDENYYIRQGIGEVPRHFHEGLVASGGRVMLGRRPRRLRVEDGRVVAVELDEGPDAELPCDALLSTIPLEELVALAPDAPRSVVEAAGALDHCATVLLFLKVAAVRALPASVLYFSDPAIRFARVSDFSAFSPDMAPPGHSLLCVEFPCLVGTPTWNSSDEDLCREAVAVLSASGVLSESMVQGHFCERLPRSYPRFKIGFGGRVATCLDYVHSFGNVISYGRQGGFSYANTDEVVDLGFRAAAAVMTGGVMGQTMGAWFRAIQR